MSILERVTRAILSAMKRKPVLPLRAYQTEVEILARAIAATSTSPSDTDATQCVIGRQPSKLIPT